MRIKFIGLALCGLLFFSGAVKFASACDTALVLLMDRSNSMTNEEFDLQLQGTASALASPEVIASVLRRDGGGSIQARVATFDDRFTWHTPWVRIASSTDAMALSEGISSMRRVGWGQTDTGMALREAVKSFEDLPVECDRMVVDVSTDGIAQDPRVLAEAREEAETRGVIVNAIAISIPSNSGSQHGDEPSSSELAEWAREHLITGIGSFAVQASFQSFPRAMRAKLLMEIAGIQDYSTAMISSSWETRQLQ